MRNTGTGCDRGELLQGGAAVDRDVGTRSGRELQVAAQDGRPALDGDLLEQHRLAPAVAEHGAPPSARTLRTQPVPSPSMATR